MPRTRPPHNVTETPVSPLTTPIEVDREVLARLRPEAARRDTTVGDLIASLLDVIAADHLTTAILARASPSCPSKVRRLCYSLRR
jgi:hypothetical protein